MSRTIQSRAALLGALLLLGWTWTAKPADAAVVATICSASNTTGCTGTCWCPDDYCAKPGPCVCLPATCGGCDDYCAKPGPCVCLPTTCGGCDDYCPKPAPCISWPCLFPDFYRCVPTR